MRNMRDLAGIKKSMLCRLRAAAAAAVAAALIAALPGVLPALPAEANNDGDPTIMAYNIYADPDLSGTDREFDGFSIDFMATAAPVNTYWALCNWDMDLSSLKKDHPDADGMGCYGGLQNTRKGRKALMSFWEVLDGSGKTILRAKRVYPGGVESFFDGEGEGTNYMRNYEWTDNTWYRMVLRSWTDEETGRTFVGQWFLDTSTGEWTEPVYFDTGLTDSFMKGGMSFFQENFNGENRYEERSFRLTGVYAKERAEESWTSLPSSRLSHDTYNNKNGVWSFGADSDAFFGSAGGRVDDQEAFNAEHRRADTFTIVQPDEPDMGSFSIGSMDVSASILSTTVSWETAAGSVPLLSARAYLKDVSSAEIIREARMTRPEKTSVSLGRVAEGDYSLTLELTDIFGRTARQTRRLLVTGGGQPVLSARQTAEVDGMSMTDLSPAAICELIVDHYTREFQPDGEYVIFPEFDSEFGNDTYTTILRYQMSDAEQEERIARGAMPMANVYASQIIVYRRTGQVLDEFFDESGRPGEWYLQDEPGFERFARADGALIHMDDKIELETDGPVITLDDFEVGGESFDGLTAEAAKEIYGAKTFTPPEERGTVRDGRPLMVTWNAMDNDPDMPADIYYVEGESGIAHLQVRTKDINHPERKNSKINGWRFTDTLQDVVIALDLPDTFRDKVLFDLGGHMDVQIRRPVQGESGDYVLYAGNVSDRGDQTIMIIDDDVQAEFTFTDGLLVCIDLYDLRDFYR